MAVSLINYLTAIHFGSGAVTHVPEILTAQRVSRPLVVSDRGLVALGMVDRLPIAPTAIFAEIPSNPTESSAQAGADVFRENECDGIIAIGGGSPIDCAKAISVLVGHPGSLGDFALIRGGIDKITANKPPLIAVPTTSGTGSEVGRGSLMTLADGEKLALISPHLIPTVAVCDPDLTLELPPLLTAATGMDAISHCVETFCSPKSNPVADSIALDGLGRAFRAIRRCVHQGSDIEARGEMMMAALQGGLTFQKGLGMIHSLSHPMGAIPTKNLHHGTLNAVFLPHVLRYNFASCPQKMRIMAEVMGVCAAKLPEVFERLNNDIGLPDSLSRMGVVAADLSDIPRLAMQDHSTPSNPREMTLEDCEELLRASL